MDDSYIKIFTSGGPAYGIKKLGKDSHGLRRGIDVKVLQHFIVALLPLNKP
jgi:hypothetical protein